MQLKGTIVSTCKFFIFSTIRVLIITYNFRIQGSCVSAVQPARACEQGCGAGPGGVPAHREQLHHPQQGQGLQQRVQQA